MNISIEPLKCSHVRVTIGNEVIVTTKEALLGNEVLSGKSPKITVILNNLRTHLGLSVERDWTKLAIQVAIRDFKI